MKIFIDAKRFVFSLKFCFGNGAIIELLSNNSHQCVIGVFQDEGA